MINGIFNVLYSFFSKRVQFFYFDSLEVVVLYNEGEVENLICCFD